MERVPCLERRPRYLKHRVEPSGAKTRSFSFDSTLLLKAKDDFTLLCLSLTSGKEDSARVHMIHPSYTTVYEMFAHVSTWISLILRRNQACVLFCPGWGGVGGGGMCSEGICRLTEGRAAPFIYTEKHMCETAYIHFLGSLLWGLPPPSPSPVPVCTDKHIRKTL